MTQNKFCIQSLAFKEKTLLNGKAPKYSAVQPETSTRVSKFSTEFIC